MSTTSIKGRTKKPKSKPERPKAFSGVVFHCVRGDLAKTSDREWTPTRLVGALRVGLPINELRDLQTSLDVPMERLAQILGISKATLQRRKEEGRLDSFESDRVVRFARLLGRAVDVLESEKAAREWLASPQVGLGGETPLTYAESEIGAREVEDLLGRIEHGVYS